MTNFKKNDSSVGLLIQRKNIPYPIVEVIHKELLIYLFEIQIMLQSINNIRSKKLKFLDGHVGDAKCQTRASMIIDLFENETQLLKILDQDKHQLEKLEHKIQKIIYELHLEDYNFIKQNLKHFKYASMLDFITKYNISFIPSPELLFIGLCSIVHLSRQKINDLMHKKISINKIDKLRELAKIKLCSLSVEYEQNLALQCGSSQDCKVLTQIESKKYSSALSLMTACFPSFKLILEKIKQKKQSLLLHNTIFCQHGGTISKQYIAYKLKNNNFEAFNIDVLFKKEPIVIIEGYQFPGSFHQLKKLLNVPEDAALIDQSFQKNCICSRLKLNSSIIDFEKIMLGYFAQHPQFITESEINWKDLGLEDSDLKKEFDYLKTIPGCSNNDMSIFTIKHVYTSTIEAVLKEQEELEAQL